MIVDVIYTTAYNMHILKPAVTTMTVAIVIVVTAGFQQKSKLRVHLFRLDTMGTVSYVG